MIKHEYRNNDDDYLLVEEARYSEPPEPFLQVTVPCAGYEAPDGALMDAPNAFFDLTKEQVRFLVRVGAGWLKEVSGGG